MDAYIKGEGYSEISRGFTLSRTTVCCIITKCKDTKFAWKKMNVGHNLKNFEEQNFQRCQPRWLLLNWPYLDLMFQGRLLWGILWRVMWSSTKKNSIAHMQKNQSSNKVCFGHLKQGDGFWTSVKLKLFEDVDTNLFGKQRNSSLS